MMGSNICFKGVICKIIPLTPSPLEHWIFDLYLLVQLDYIRTRSCVPYTLSTDF